MTADPIETSTETIRDAKAATVYVKQYWADTWAEKEKLWVDYATWVASPQVSRAQLTWLYGVLFREGLDMDYGAVEPLDIDGWWVKIVFDQGDDPDLKWYGTVEENVRIADGHAADAILGGSETPRGRQVLVCHGMEAVLDRQQVRESWYLKLGVEYRVLVGLEFNEPNQSDNAGNMTQAAGPKGVFLFTSDPEVAWKWSTRRIVQYLLEYATPRDWLGNEALPWEPHTVDSNYYLPDWDEPRLAQHGRTLKHVLDAVMDRRRGLSYTVEVNPAEDAVWIRPFTFLDTDLPTPSGWTLVANKNQKTLDFGAALGVANVQIRKSEAAKYHQVRAYGRRLTACETLSTLATTLEKGWTATEQTVYNAGASGEPDYGTLTRAEQEQRNADVRTAEELQRVYSWFSPPSTWTPCVEVAAVYADLKLDEDQDRLYYPLHLRFDRHLPLKTDHVYDYVHSGDPILIEPTNNTPDDKQWEYRRPLVVMANEDLLPCCDGKYVVVDKMPVASMIEGTGDGLGRTMACSVRMQDGGPGLILKVSGLPQHAIAATDYSEPGGADIGSTYQPLGNYDWQDDLLATIATTADYYVQEHYPEGSVPGLQCDVYRALYLDASARCGLEAIGTATLVDVQDGDKIETADMHYCRDDRELLEDVARIAYEWHSVDRQSLTITYRQIENAGLFKVGHLITKIGSGATEEDIRTVITSVEIRMPQTKNQPHTVTVRTQWVELNFVRMLT